jgi:5-methylthioribose kinase
VLKQPLPKFKTAAEWLVDIDRVNIEHDCMVLLGQLLPVGSVPDVLWMDQANYILAISAAPTGSVIWKNHLLAGHISSDAANHAGMLLAMMHSATKDDAALAQRYGNERLFIQQRTDPYLAELFGRHGDLKPVLEKLIAQLLTAKRCLIHGDYSPKNIFLVPYPGESFDALPRPARNLADPPLRTLSNLMLLDFEVAFYGHPAFDVATLTNHLLLKAFYLGKPWRAAMIAIDNFWQTYRHTADQQLTALVERSVGHMLGALLLARVDGKSPAEYLVGNQPATERVRATGRAILQTKDATLESALEIAAQTLEQAHG